MIDKDGFRLNVGIVLCNDQGQLAWGRRCRGKDAWQFPQGGVKEGESPHEAMLRELHEELGLRETDVKVLTESRDWLTYLLPDNFRRYDNKPLCIGQRQKWLLLQLTSPDSAIHFTASDTPEFDAWRWVEYWYPVDHVIHFKREVYVAALKEFESVVLPPSPD